MTNSIERESILSEITEIEEILAELTEDQSIERLGFEGRLKKVQDELTELDAGYWP